MLSGPSLDPSSRTPTRICTLNWCPAVWFAGGRTWNASAYVGHDGGGGGASSLTMSAAWSLSPR